MRKPRKPRRSTRNQGRAARARADPRPSEHRRRRDPAPPEEHAPAIAAADDAAAAQASFPIVGIGASAGGLEALEVFLKNVSPRTGTAFVVVQHLDPTHKDVMVELLQRVSPLPVVQAKENLRVEPDRVYVAPPNRDLSILHGVLHLLPPAAPRGINLPIDGFFRSLADDRQERSVAVILSGMGSDGTLGMRAIKEKAGAGFVQAPASAKFDGMPKSAIDAGLADVVAAVEELPARIRAYLEHVPYITKRTEPAVEKGQSAVERILVLLRMQTGNDFSLYKRSTVYRRIERRMGLHQVDRIGNYVRYLRENPKEVELLFKELLIGVTSFFRDPPAWERLGNDVLPALIAQRPSGAVLRAWVPGCSTGEEAYSLAIVFKEALERLDKPKNLMLQIFATDLDRDAIEKARQGIYPSNIAADVSPERLRRFFYQEERGYRVSKEIREMAIFAPQNVIMDPPFTKLDIVSCRNLLIYLAPETQKRLVPLFHYSLNPGGVLFLGTAETIGGFSSDFAALDGKTRIYRRLDSGTGAPELPAAFGAPQFGGRTTADMEPLASARHPVNVQAVAERVLLQRFSPAGVLVNERGDILFISGRTGKYLEPAMGKANWNVFAMAREGLRIDLNNAFSRAHRDDVPVTVHGAKVGTNGGSQAVDITVQRIEEPRELRGTYMVVFTDVRTPPEEPRGKGRAAPRQGTRLAEIERELQRAREEVQTTREEMQTSQEELKSTNEELQSTNEELQSTNEELTTSKEEMQSLNEELQTVNHELQAKVDELSHANNDMKNLLNSTDIATLFLDAELRVRRFTTQTTKIIKLIPVDAGRPITDLVTELDYPSLASDAREVLRTLVFSERLVGAHDGRWFTARIMPYRTIDNVIDGVVITFTDATAAKALETALREQASQLEQLAESLPTLVWGARPDGACDYLSRQWVEYTGVPEGEQLGHRWFEQVHPDDRERVREEWKKALRSATSLDTDLRLRSKQGTYRWHKMRAVPIRNEQGAVVKWYGTHTDVDEIKRAQEERRAASERPASVPADGGEPGRT